jgi:hypothetical protein
MCDVHTGHTIPYFAQIINLTLNYFPPQSVFEIEFVIYVLLSRP